MADIEEFIGKFGGITESYWFYNHTIELRYDVKNHVYLLVTPDGQLEVQDGVTNICHIMDKSMVLIPWSCKMMQQKLMLTVPTVDGTVILPRTEFEKLVAEAKSAHKEKLDDASNIGNIAHNWIETYIKAVLAKDDGMIEQILNNMPAEERAKNACIAALDWMHSHNVRWLCTERKVYSKKHKVAGTLDGLCLADACDDPLCCPNKFKNRLSICDWKSSNYLYAEYLLQTAIYQEAYVEETGEKVTDRWIVRLGKDDAAFEKWHLEKNTYKCDLAAFLAALKLKRSMDTVEARMTSTKSARSVRVKAAKSAAKIAANKIKCSKADKYKGQRKPTCGCQFCENLYQEMQKAKEQRDADAAQAKAEKRDKKAARALVLPETLLEILK
jgi:hypothetical protein